VDSHEIELVNGKCECKGAKYLVEGECYNCTYGCLSCKSAMSCDVCDTANDYLRKKTGRGF
jgi:hypothetical protein